jgi:hypothetical protein
MRSWLDVYRSYNISNKSCTEKLKTFSHFPYALWYNWTWMNTSKLLRFAHISQFLRPALPPTSCIFKEYLTDFGQMWYQHFKCTLKFVTLIKAQPTSSSDVAFQRAASSLFTLAQQVKRRCMGSVTGIRFGASARQSHSDQLWRSASPYGPR